MKKKKILIAVSLLLLLLLLGSFYFFKPLKPIQQDIAISVKKSLPLKGATDKKDLPTICNGKDKICIIKDGKIISKTITPKDSEYAKKQCKTNTRCNIIYAENVKAAVAAVREYTGIPNLNITALEKDSVPEFITYYCADNKHCWAIDHVTHKVVEGL